MGLDIVFVLFIIRLMSTLFEDLGIYGTNFPRKLNCNLRRLRSQFL